MVKPVQAVIDNIINLAYPLHCAICKKKLDPSDKRAVCHFCMSSIARNPKPYCRSCVRSHGGGGAMCGECVKAHFVFLRAWSACLYKDNLKELIHMLKYNRKKYLSKTLSKLMIDFVNEEREVLEDVDAITFVPISSRRFADRGFNQSELFAKDISKMFGVPVIDLLKKIKKTANQNELSRDGRLLNLKNAFKVRRGPVIGDLRLLLVDDVMTTGATLNECAKALLASGAKDVRCLTLARGL
jgi:ComF family protein